MKLNEPHLFKSDNESFSRDGRFTRPSIASVRIVRVKALVASLLLGGAALGGCGFQLRTEPSSECKARVEKETNSDALTESLKLEANGAIPSEVLEMAGESLSSDRETKLIVFAECMQTKGAECFVDLSVIGYSNEAVERELVSRGWADPVLWDCYWPKTGQTVTNPFK